MSEMLEAALALARRRRIFPCCWPVFSDGAVTCSCDPWRATQRDQNGKPLGPCRSIGKHPRIGNGLYGATTDARKIRWWWGEWPLANIGLSTGPENDLLALDVDPRHGGDETLAALEREHEPLPLTRRTISGSGGAHIFFRHVDGLANLVGELGGGLDIRTQGGLVVVPPSLHSSGKRYRWANDAPVAEAPGWLIEAIKNRGGAAPVPGGGQVDYWDRIAGGVREGERHVMILKLAGLLIGDRRLPPRLALALLRGFNLRHCNPPLDESEVDELFARVVKRELKRMGE